MTNTQSTNEPPAGTHAEIAQLPPEQAINRMISRLEPISRVIQPKVYGIENLPDDGSLLVGNHTIYGILDLPFMLAEIWKRRRIIVRSLGDHAFYKIPGLPNLIGACGVVEGTRDNVRALMRDHQTILVFPGGAREVNKRREEAYLLLWKERLGFALLAIEHGYPIIPFAAVGAEEEYDVIIDQDTPVYGEFAREYEKLMGFPTPPVVRGIGPTAIPRPERLYFWFGDPIDATRYTVGQGDSAARTVRDETKQAVLGGIEFLRTEREHDPNRRLARRLSHLSG